jgi:hypothetical protein
MTCSNCSENHPTRKCRRPNQGHSQHNSYNTSHLQSIAIPYDEPLQGFQPKQPHNSFQNQNQPRYEGKGQHSSHKNQGYNYGIMYNQGLNRDDYNPILVITKIKLGPTI